MSKRAAPSAARASSHPLAAAAEPVSDAERKQFKLARRRAIEKLRRFALADPYFYILEIIQAAIAGPTNRDAWNNAESSAIAGAKSTAWRRSHPPIAFNQPPRMKLCQTLNLGHFAIWSKTERRSPMRSFLFCTKAIGSTRRSGARLRR